jgi:enterochelin esterase-like enzyme
MRTRWAVPAAAAVLALLVGAALDLRSPPPALAARVWGYALAAPNAVSDTPTASIGPSPSAAPAHSSVQTLTLPSKDRGRTSRVVKVYRPAVADSADLPVLYLLHGQYGGPDDPFRAGMVATLDRLFRGGLRPFVVAVPDGASVTRSDDEWGDAADRADLLESFLNRDVIPAVEGMHPRDRAHRAVAGFSMGGYAAAYTAELHTSTFGQVVSLAGYFHPDDPDGVFPSSAQQWAHYPIARAWTLDRTRVLLLDCSRETDPVIRGELDRMRRALARGGHPPGALVTSGGHSWSWVQSTWPTVARFLGEGWAR